MSTLEVISHQLEKILVHLKEMICYDMDTSITVSLLIAQVESLKNYVDNKIKENEQ